MNRLHVHLHVHDVAQSVRFYSALFGTAPARQQADYAKWMLDDPLVNFAISSGGEAGLGHLGIQVEDAAALAQATARAKEAAGSVFEEQGARCCYAIGDKAWVSDPQGVRWETFRTTGDLTVYGVGASQANEPEAASCCTTAAPKREQTEACCGGQC
ncbi:MAG TPA: ArsI/CadI family heavy metal resistance metalloenzyme [Rhizomicrobium sp.]|nr:ArsI/CadI family heavy metal resistance metalloenzyme [Rhizomicrobium sp.]